MNKVNDIIDQEIEKLYNRCKSIKKAFDERLLTSPPKSKVQVQIDVYLSQIALLKRLKRRINK